MRNAYEGVLMKSFDTVRYWMLIWMLIAVPVTAQSLLNSPESIVYDALQKRYLVSNATGGGIVQIDSLGTQTVFASGLNSIRGLHIVGNTVWAASVSGVVGFDLTTASRIMTVVIPGSLFLNDITSDNNGFLYVTDTDLSKIYKINPGTGTSWTFVNSGVQSPNGLLYDPANSRLLLCSFKTNSPIQGISLTDSSVSVVKTTTLRNLDGLAGDHAGNVYVSSWGTGMVYRFDSQFLNAPVSVSTGHNGPADIVFVGELNRIAVPNFNANTISFIELTVSVKDDFRQSDVFDLKQNFPNPFNPSTTIVYELTSNGYVSLSIYNILGQEVRTLVSGFQTAGNKAVRWDGRDQSGRMSAGGIYFYKLAQGNSVQIRRMILMK